MQCPMCANHTDIEGLGPLGDLIWYKCRSCGWQFNIPYDDAGIEDCPVCGESCKDDVTIEDHGMCYDCHHAVLDGELCAYCLEERPCDCDAGYDPREEALTAAERNPGLVTRGLL